MNVSRIGRAPAVRRRVVLGTAGAAVCFFVLGSVAWACTQRVGTMLVCRPPASTYVSGTRCGRVTSTTQTGSPTVYKAGSNFSVKATNFYAKRYQVTFRNAGSTASCHNVSSATQILTSVTPTLSGSAPAGQNSFVGPSFQAEFKSPAQTATGQAKVCTEDVPDVITGQVINLTVI